MASGLGLPPTTSDRTIDAEDGSISTIELGFVVGVPELVLPIDRRKVGLEFPAGLLGEKFRARTVLGQLDLAAAQLALRGKLLPPAEGGAPPFALLMVPGLVLTLLAALSPLGARLADRLPFAALIGFQAFRIPLEALLYAFHTQGRLPVQMTFAGRNFDVLTGIAAIGIAWMAARGKAGSKAIMAWNLAGLKCARPSSKSSLTRLR